MHTKPYPAPGLSPLSWQLGIIIRVFIYQHHKHNIV